MFSSLLIKADSSIIDEFKYDEQQKHRWIKFKGKKNIYRYFDVPK